MVESLAPVEPVMGPTRPILGDSVCDSAGERRVLPEKVPFPSEINGISTPDTLTIIAKSSCNGRKSIVSWKRTFPLMETFCPLREWKG
ncbi:MAG: Uncharacterised protein [Marine Group II euryarchaeote MED-G33]|nr:MAG: Uncharacterised protein [Marine Group II euryarchaeote MED-G33]